MPGPRKVTGALYRALGPPRSTTHGPRGKPPSTRPRVNLSPSKLLGDPRCGHSDRAVGVGRQCTDLGSGHVQQTVPRSRLKTRARRPRPSGAPAHSAIRLAKRSAFAKFALSIGKELGPEAARCVELTLVGERGGGAARGFSPGL